MTLYRCRRCGRVEIADVFPMGWVEPCGSNLEVVTADCATCVKVRRYFERGIAEPEAAYDTEKKGHDEA